ncbi:hypothetical protein [Chitinophaga flava]|uniref:Uncharacterized protein n=1 Tax=Chitinophaga flava TaxID=2259036 RepID=A0A365Y5B7_9BACT|nr:hypothetical protein [Chitinophaga flava]RBL93501.1 hypothetical protein DF182_13390 [Chitinophaga flava]
MRKQLCEIRDIEQYLENNQESSDRLVFEAKAVISSELSANIGYQQKIIQLVRWFSRKEKRKQLDDLYLQVMKDEQYRQTFISIFQ